MRSAPPPSPALSWILLAAVAVVTLGLDQLTKNLVLSRFSWGQAWNPVEGLARYFSITPVANTGGAFGLLPDQGTLLTILALIVVAGILYYQRQLASQNVWLAGLLGLQLGGAMGNLTDRLRFGHVVDFIDFKFWPVFNLADSAIVIGVGLLVLWYWRHPEEPITISHSSTGEEAAPESH